MFTLAKANSLSWNSPPCGAARRDRCAGLEGAGEAQPYCVLRMEQGGQWRWDIPAVAPTHTPGSALKVSPLGWPGGPQDACGLRLHTSALPGSRPHGDLNAPHLPAPPPHPCGGLCVGLDRQIHLDSAVQRIWTVNIWSLPFNCTGSPLHTCLQAVDFQRCKHAVHQRQI